MSEDIKQSGSAAEAKPVTVLPAEEIAKEIKPLSKNGFLAFWQKLWRKWLGWWYGFSDRHPKGSKAIYMVVFFVLFSQGVTIFQYLLFLFLPHLFGQGLAEFDWLLPRVLMGTDANGVEYFFSILGKPLAYNDAGGIIIGGGLGYFLAFLIATFLAQVINFPLQRNITFKSKGNPYYQAMWYFIGWLLIQPFCDMIGSIWKGLVGLYLGTWPVAVMTLLDTIIMGGVAMAIFFVVFLIIFPNVDATQKRAQKKYDALKANPAADPAKLAAAELKLTKAIEEARLFNGRTGESKAISLANSRSVTYQAVAANAEKAKAKVAEIEAANADDAKFEEAKAKAAAIDARLPEYQKKASEAIATKYEAIETNKLAISEVYAARKERGEDEKGKPLSKSN